MKILFLGPAVSDSDQPTARPFGAELVDGLSACHEVRTLAAAGARQAVWKMALAWIPDVVLGCWSETEAATALQIARLLGVPSVVVIAGSDVSRASRNPQDVSAVIAADAVVAVGGDRLALETLGVQRDRLRLVDDGVALAEPLSRVVSEFGSQSPDRPHWATWGPAPAGGVVIQRSFARQVVRKSMDLLPRRLFLTHGPRRDNELYLTFDDGPHPLHTPRLLDQLARLRIRATFFVVGRQVVRHPELIRRMADEGHAVANHSFLHTDLRLLSPAEAVWSAQALREELRPLLGSRQTRLYRPPRGKIGAAQAIGLWRAGYTIVLWSADARDWACDGVEPVRQWARSHPFRGGDIVLMHDRLPFAADVLSDIQAAVNAHGLQFAALASSS